MLKRFSVSLIALMGLLVISPMVVGENTPDNTPAMQKLDVDMSDLLAVTGLNIYKYRLDLEPGRRFHVILREQRSAESSLKVLFQETFHRNDEPDMTMRVSFLSLDEKLAGVLLSEDREAEFRLSLEGTVERGLAAIVPVPLAGVERTELMYVTLWGNQHPIWNSDDDSIQLIALFPSSKANKSGDKGFPRAELVIIPD